MRQALFFMRSRIGTPAPKRPNLRFEDMPTSTVREDVRVLRMPDLNDEPALRKYIATKYWLNPQWDEWLIQRFIVRLRFPVKDYTSMGDTDDH